MLEADGSVRIVDYTADEKHGFNAVVKHKGASYHPTHTTHPVSQSELHLKAIQPVKPHVNFEQVHFAYHNHQMEEEAAEDPKYQIKDETPQFIGDDDVKSHKETYVFVPQEEVHNYEPNDASGYETHNKESYSRHALQQAEEASQKNHQSTVLPVDIDYIKPKHKLTHLDVSLIKPVEVDLSNLPNYQQEIETPKEPAQKPADADWKPSHELTDEEIAKFVKEYYKNEGSKETYTDNGFRPLAPTYLTSQTYKSGKKPITTPGLKNYSSQKGYGYTPPKTNRLEYHRPAQKPSGPILFPPNYDSRIKNRLYRNVPVYGRVRIARRFSID